MKSFVTLFLFLLIPSISPAEVDESLLENFTWRSVGPAGAGGRVVDVEVVGEYPHHVFVATASGGLWRSTNHGVTWEPIFDKEATISIGAVAVHPDNPDIIWVGTGEANARNSVSCGDGVYKSTDGGKSWKNVGLRETHHIGRMVVDPRDPDTVYVAALGHLWAPNEQRGLYKTTDGGETWVESLKINDDTGHQAESSELGELTGTKIPEIERRLNELQVPRIRIGGRLRVDIEYLALTE